MAALFVAGCTTSDRPTEPATQISATAPNFTEIPPGTACMGDLIWNDLNCNGVQDEGEPGLGGVTVKLYECPSNVLIDETVSEPNGYYALFGPAPDDYYIVVTLPGENCSFSPANVGQPAGVRDITNDSDVDANGKGFCTNLSDQEIEKRMDAGICCEEICESYIGDRVWFDANCDGLQGEDEEGVPGVTVKLTTCEGDVLFTTTTDASGGYMFGPLEAGTYKVCFEALPGSSFSPQDIGDNDGLDSDVGADGCTDCIELGCNETNNSVDAGLCEDGTGCRVTGGGVDSFGEWTGETSEGKCKRDSYTFGGQAGANTALQPQPKGEWQHNNHKGPSGSWAFHGGTSSASAGTEIDRIECSDPGFCNPARHAPAKQIDFWGVGEFSNAKTLSPIMAEFVVAHETLHWFEVNIDDGGEPGNGKKGMNGCPEDGFGLHGSVANVDCDCPDFYRITIHATADPSSPVIYQVWGYPQGGNLQIHPLTGFDLH
jgi:hypothetical protein